MKTPASVVNHPIHPLLVAFPIGLWVASALCDIIGLATGDRQHWSTLAWYAMVGGVIGGFFAAIPGLIDFSALRDAQHRRVGRLHGVLNGVIWALFALNAWARGDEIGTPAASLVVLSIVSVFALAVSGFLGSHLVHVYGIGVVEPDSPEAHSNPTDPAKVPGGGLPDRPPGERYQA